LEVQLKLFSSGLQKIFRICIQIVQNKIENLKKHKTKTISNQSFELPSLVTLLGSNFVSEKNKAGHTLLGTSK